MNTSLEVVFLNSYGGFEPGTLKPPSAAAELIRRARNLDTQNRTVRYFLGKHSFHFWKLRAEAISALAVATRPAPSITVTETGRHPRLNQGTENVFFTMAHDTEDPLLEFTL